MVSGRPSRRRSRWRSVAASSVLRKATNDRALVDEVSWMDNSVDDLNEAIKLYVTKLTRGSLDE
jgi:hypothetical protein